MSNVDLDVVSSSQIKRAWGEEDFKALKKFIEGDYGVDEAAKRCGRTVHAIYHKINRMNWNQKKWESVREYENLTVAERAYVAGIIDGEGYIGIINDSEVRVQVTNTSFELIDYLVAKVGGSCGRESRSWNHAKWKPKKTWTLSRSVNVVRFLESILEYLIVKRDKAEMAISLYKNKRRIK